METKKIVMGVISIAVAIIVLMSMIPIFTDAGASEDTFTNEGLWEMKPIENGDKWTYDNGTWSYGDTVLTPVTSGGSNALLGEEWCIRSSGQFRSTTVEANWTAITAIAVTDVVKVYRDLTMTNNPYTSSDLTGYGAVNKGDYVMTDGTDWYSSGDSVMFGTGQSVVDSVNIFVHVDATVDDGATFTVSSLYGAPAISNVSVTNEKVNYTAVSGFKDLYTVSSITCDISFDTLDDNDDPVTHTGSLTYNRLVVDKEITAERSAHASPVEATLIGLIPLLMMVGIMLTAVGLFIAKYRKN